MKYVTYVGHNTDAREEGIRILETDADSGAFRVLETMRIRDAIYMAVNRAGTRLYASFLQPGLDPRRTLCGALASYRIDGAKLVKLNQVRTYLTAACHVSLAPDESSLVFGEYHHSSVGCAAIGPDGAFRGDPMVRRHYGLGPNQPRQDKSHTHCAVVTPDGKYLCAVDLGTDRVFVYDYARRRENGGLEECADRSFSTRPAGAGPRHLLFHPNGKIAFVIFELGNRVASYRYEDGWFAEIRNLPLLPPDFKDFSKAAAIRLSEDGRRLFCSNRGHDSISVFDVDPETGAMEPKAIWTLGGRWPRDFAFAPGEKILMACLKMSGTIRTYAYDRDRCAIEPVASVGGLHLPLFVQFGGRI